MTEIQNSKHVLVIEYWYLRFICNLMLGIWDFGSEITKFEFCVLLSAPCSMIYAHKDIKKIAMLPST
jgi:hypothetical protein